MNIDLLDIYKKIVSFVANRTKIILISVVVLVFSFETSNVILEIAFAEKPVINHSASSKIQIKKVNSNSFQANYSQTISLTSNLANKAQETSLSLKLFGVTSSKDKNFAIIGLDKTDQKEYQAGDQVLDNVYLEAIHKDYVTINRAGTSESLSFDKSNYISGIGNKTQINSSNKNQYNPISADWLSNQNILEAVSFTPIFTNGALTGLEVNPGENKESFVDLTFMPGDILYSINGSPVSDLSENYLTNLENLFNEPQNLNFTVLRNSYPLSIGIKIN